jgi:hypothetical protein
MPKKQESSTRSKGTNKLKKKYFKKKGRYYSFGFLVGDY